MHIHANGNINYIFGADLSPRRNQPENNCQQDVMTGAFLVSFTFYFTYPALIAKQNGMYATFHATLCREETQQCENTIRLGRKRRIPVERNLLMSPVINVLV